MGDDVANDDDVIDVPWDVIIMLYMCNLDSAVGTCIGDEAVCCILCYGVVSAVWKISANFLSISNCSSPTFKNGVAGMGCWRQ
eukprot:2210304-Ditylum_brightwellii.AAC.1